jgi:hypothetical protein
MQGKVMKKKVETEVPVGHVCEENCDHPKLTQDEITNLLVLIQAGARALSAQQGEMDKAGEILMVAHNLSVKVKSVN